ncbi:unnamed protein product [Owenia fusiformis]|uniref:Uncharacterized protein n=1 Tax=Owenia fusiformis TaxID=6347 RepID=A0A8J1YA91_OWEFU|nr:unnamed protein product [Owenia fusiformis]
MLGRQSKFDRIFSETATQELQLEECPVALAEVGKQPNCFRISLTSSLVIAVVCVTLVICHEYVAQLLYWMESIYPAASCAIFLFLVIIVSFPMTWGYLLLNIASGYLYGPIYGLFLVSTSAVCGILVSDLIIRKCLSELVAANLKNESLLALLRVVEGHQGFKVVALARLTPIPFGLQNGVFAMVKISKWQYLAASWLGLLPTQLLNGYIGSTLRSMEDVLTDNKKNLMGYIMFSIQILLTIALMIFVVRKARQELKKITEEHQLKVHDDNKDNQFIPVTVDMQRNLPSKVQLSGELSSGSDETIHCSRVLTPVHLQKESPLGSVSFTYGKIGFNG